MDKGGEGSGRRRGRLVQRHEAGFEFVCVYTAYFICTLSTIFLHFRRLASCPFPYLPLYFHSFFFLFSFLSSSMPAFRLDTRDQGNGIHCMPSLSHRAPCTVACAATLHAPVCRVPRFIIIAITEYIYFFFFF